MIPRVTLEAVDTLGGKPFGTIEALVERKAARHGIGQPIRIVTGKSGPTASRTAL